MPILLPHLCQPDVRARFSFAHGGKDGHPYPVDRETYDKTIGVLREAIDKAKVGDREKMDAIRRLKEFNVKCQSQNVKIKAEVKVEL